MHNSKTKTLKIRTSERRSGLYALLGALLLSLMVAGGAWSCSDDENGESNGGSQGAENDAPDSGDSDGDSGGDGDSDGDSDGDAPGDEDDAPVERAACELVPEGFGPAGTAEITVEVVASGLSVPWSIGFLPGGDLLVTERYGAVVRVRDGELVEPPVATIDIDPEGEGGLLGLAMHPDFETNRLFYTYHTEDDPSGAFNRITRWSLAEDGLSASVERVVLDGIPAGRFHNGGRIRFGPDGFLYIGTGDAIDPDSSQDTMSLAGKILRIDEDGGVPSDNPFPGSATWVYGVRNTQGFDWLDDGTMVMTDHGPTGSPWENGREGHDELNVVFPGDNLGWPDTYACEEAEGQLPPSMVWFEAMPPGGTAIYRGSEVPEWQGDVFIGVLGFGEQEIGHLHRARLNETFGVDENETYLFNRFGRLREVIMGPDGGLYVTTSNCGDGRGICDNPLGDLVLRVGRR
ncbi:MAG: PQQ-dependent sugar dehydrogenase [Myxococcota bacterium]